jgi:hypothetical protein
LTGFTVKSCEIIKKSLFAWEERNEPLQDPVGFAAAAHFAH